MTLQKNICYTNSNSDLYIRISNIKKVSKEGVEVTGFVFRKKGDWFYGVDDYFLRYDKIEDWYVHGN